MNKLFTKVAALTLGLAMAAGVGVAVGASQKASAAEAAQATITPSQFTAVTSASSDETIDGIRFELTNSTITSDQYRVFKGQTLKISAPANNLLTSVAITCTASGTSKYGPGCMAAMTGYSYSGTVGTWTGSASNITFTAQSNQVRITQFVIDYEPEQTDEPKVSLSKENINFIENDSAEAVTVTPNSAFTDVPTISVEGTPAYVDVAIDGLSLYVLPKAVGNETVTVKATNDTQVATATFTVKVVPSHGRSEDDPYTVPEVIAAIDAEYTTFGKVYVAGIVSSVEIPSEFSGSLCYYISADGTTSAPQFKIYWGKGLNNQNFTSADDVQVGATIVNYGAVTKYNSEYEFSSGSYLISYQSAGPDLTSVEIGGSASAVAGKSWNYDGVTVTAHYSDESTKDVKEFCTIVIEEVPVESMTSATVKVTYKDQDYTETIPVSVSPAPAAKDFQKITSTSELADGKYLIVFEDSDSETPAPLTFDSTLETLDAVSNTVGVVVEDSKINISEDEAFEIKEETDGYTIKSSSGYYIGQTSDANGLQASKTVEYKNSITFDDNGSANISSSGAFLRYNNASNQTRFRYYKSASYTAQKPIALYKVYEAPEEGWPADQKAALETALHGYVPPYFGELVEDLATTENSAVFTVSGDLSDQFATKLGDGWDLVSGNNYMFVGDNYYLTASIYTYGVRLDVGDYSEFTFTYHEGQPVQNYSVTYTAGQGTGDNYVVSDVESGSSHALVTFETAEFTAPEGQQFKGWQVGNDAELRDAGYEITVDGDVTVTAIYEDIPVTDWSETFKTTFQSRFGTSYLPPFVNAEFANESNQNWYSTYPYCNIEVEGNFYSNAVTLFNNDSNWILVGYDEYDCPIFMSSDQKAFVIIDAYMKVEDGPVYTSLTFECVGDYAVVTTDAKTEYYVGDDLNLTNVKLCAQLLDGTIIENLTIPQSYWSVSPTKLTEAGDEVVITIAVAALEAEFTYNVKVTPVMVESISISGELSKTEYTEGEDWSAEGLAVTAHYNNGTEADVTDQVTWSFDPAETAVEVSSVSVVAHLDELSSDAAVFDVTVEQNYGADAFAKDLLDLVAPICAKYDGKKNNKAALKTVWDTMSQRYSTLSNEEKAKVIAAAAKTDGTDLEKAMAFYNYACKKYGLTKFIEGRQVKALVAEHETGNSILPIVVIVASSVAAITAIGVVIALKRRKALLAK